MGCLISRSGIRENISDVGEERLVTDRTDRQLVEAAIAGDGDSFTELCSRYYAAMVAIADSILADRHEAEDAAQHAFANAAMKLGTLKDKERFASWLAVICRNAASDLARKRERSITAEQLSAVPAKPKDDSSCTDVRAAIAGLAPEAREVIYLRYYDGLTYEKIGSVLGISQQAINGRLRRAKRKIAKYLKANGSYEV